MEEKTWDDIMSEFTGAISKDTEYAELITILVKMFFNNNELGIFTLIPEIEDVLLVDDVKKELKLKQNSIEKIRQNLIKYRDAQKQDRSVHMTNLIESCDEFYKNLITDKNNVNLLIIAITFAFIHLTILRERNRYSKEIYLTNKPNKTHETELRQKVQDYKDYFLSMYYNWEDWRKEFIHIKGDDRYPVPSFPCLVNDSYHDRTIAYKYPNSTNEMLAKYTELCNQGKMAFFNEAKDIFMKVYLHTFVLDKFLPNNWEALSVAPNRTIGTITYGIVGKNTLPNPRKFGYDYEENFKLCSDEPGIITGLNVHHSDVVHGLTVKYKGRPGTSIGDVKGGNATTVRGLDEKNRYVNGVDVYFNSERVICGLRFNFNGDITTDILGNEEDAFDFVCGPTKDYKLTGIQMASTKSFTKKLDCLGYILLTFEHFRIAQ